MSVTIGRENIATRSPQGVQPPDDEIPDYEIRVHRTLDTLPAEWPVSREGFGDSVCYPFQTRVFLEVWTRTLGSAGRCRLAFVEVRERDGAPLLFLPLAVARRHGARVLTFVDGGVADYNVPVLFPTARRWSPETAAALWRRIAGRLPAHDVALLEKMPLEAGGCVNPLALLSPAPNEVFCHGNDLGRPWSEIEAEFPQTRTLLKRIRGFEKLGGRYRVVADPADRVRTVERLVAQKQRRFEETHVPGFESDPARRAFFMEGTEAFASAGMLDLSCLEAEGETVAVLWGLVRDGRYYAVMIGHESGAWKRFSPGRIVYYKTLQRLHAEGLGYLDLGIGDEPWKLEHCRTTVPLRRATLVLTLRGRALVAALNALETLRRTRIWQSLRPFKWVILRSLRRDGAHAPGRRDGAHAPGRKDEV